MQTTDAESVGSADTKAVEFHVCPVGSANRRMGTADQDGQVAFGLYQVSGHPGSTATFFTTLFLQSAMASSQKFAQLMRWIQRYGASVSKLSLCGPDWHGAVLGALLSVNSFLLEVRHHPRHCTKCIRLLASSTSWTSPYAHLSGLVFSR